MLALEAVEHLVRAQSIEVLGQDMGLDGHFSEGGVDSLSAMELATSISRAAKVPLPGVILLQQSLSISGDTHTWLGSCSA